MSERAVSKRSRECIDTQVYYECSARQFCFDLMAQGFLMHKATVEWEKRLCRGADNESDEPSPDPTARVLRYWLAYDLLPASGETIRFSNLYDNGVAQTRSKRCPPALATDGSCIIRALAKK